MRHFKCRYAKAFLARDRYASNQLFFESAEIRRHDEQMGFRNLEAVPAEGKGQPAGTCGLFYAAQSGDAGSAAGITDQNNLILTVKRLIG
jgi:hypothetical protein